jgi:hypothetical protein
VSRQPKEQFCWYCGTSLGVYVAHPRDHDTCGKAECEREARAEFSGERGEFDGNTGDGWSA